MQETELDGTTTLDVAVLRLKIFHVPANHLRSFSVAGPSHLKSAPHDFVGNLAKTRAVTR
jgi:hypothetical protein